MKPAKRMLTIAVGLLMAGALGKEAAAEAGENKTLVEANSAFAVDLYRQLMAREGNLFYSPYGISAALAMTYAGARGPTEHDMGRVLHFTTPQEQVSANFSAMAARFERISQAGAVLTVANSLWCRNGFRLSSRYVRSAEKNYRARVESVDFATDARGASRQINGWVARATAGKIQNLVPPDGLSPATRLVLCNAVYFKGKWSHPFAAASTRPAPFFVAPQGPVPVPTMHQRANFRIAHADGLSLAELPYAGKTLSMIVLLPDARDGLPQIEKGLSAPDLSRWLSQLGAQAEEEADIYLPRFTTTREFDLSRQLADMGMASAFNANESDFSGMTGRRGLFLSGVMHKAYVEVNEAGTEAAAATGVMMSATAYHRTAMFRADHPFLFLIRENSTGTILFMGRIVDPR